MYLACWLCVCGFTYLLVISNFNQDSYCSYLPFQSTLSMERNDGINQRSSVRLGLGENFYEEIVQSHACNSLPVANVAVQLAGAAKLCSENAPNRSGFMASDRQGALTFAPLNNAHKWNGSEGKVGLKLQLNEPNKGLIPHVHAPISMVPVPKAGTCLSMYPHKKNFLVNEFLGGQFVAVPEANMPNSSDMVAGRTVIMREAPIADFSALKKMRIDWGSSATIWTVGPLQISSGAVKAQGMSPMNSHENDLEGESSGSLHENTEDLEALMSFEEDETSTGRSPNGFTCNDPLVDSSSEFSVNSFAGIRNKELLENQWSEEDEIDILCQEAESELRENECHQFSDNDDRNDAKNDRAKNNLSSGIVEPVIGLPNATQSSVNPASSFGEFSAAKRCKSDTAASGYSAVRKRPRAEKIKLIVKLLRGIIPGGNTMDTVDVLGEVIQNVRTLQSKVSKLEETKVLKIVR